MAEIGKTSQARMAERDVRGKLDQLETDMLDKIRHGNIYEEFVKSLKFKLSDFQDYFATQWTKYKGTIVQDEEMKAQFASFRPVSADDIPVQNRAAILTEEDQLMIREGLSSAMNNLASSGGKFKSVTTGKIKEDAVVEPMSFDELEEMARGTIGDWENFMSDSMNQILDAQMMADYTAKMEQVQKEVDRLIMLCKQGKIGPEYILIALAKVNQTKNGVLITHLGRKAFNLNESMNRVSDELSAISPSDPRYFAELQNAQSKTRDQNFNLNLVTQDMQKAMQDVASCLEQVQSMISEMNRTRREIIQQIRASG